MHLSSSVTALLAACLAAALFVGPAGADELADLRDQTQKRVYKDADGKTLLYRLFVPQGYDAKKKYPAVVIIHGVLLLSLTSSRAPVIDRPNNEDRSNRSAERQYSGVWNSGLFTPVRTPQVSVHAAAPCLYAIACTCPPNP